MPLQVCWPGAGAFSHAKKSSRAELGFSIKNVLGILYKYVNVSQTAGCTLCTSAEKSQDGVLERFEIMVIEAV